MMRRNRTLHVLLMTCVLLLVLGFLRQMLVDNVFYFGNIPDSFWVNKANAGADYDMVIVGDSRVYRGIAPEEMNMILGDDWRILNFGFSSGGLNPEIYEIVTDKLDPQGRRVIALGITPHSLTPASLANEHYHSVANQRVSPLSELFSLDIGTFFQPMTLSELDTIINNAPPETYYYQEPRADGWIASFREPFQVERGIEVYADIFNGNQVMPELVNALINQTEVWVNDGICVYAFRMSAVEEVMRFEDERSGFDESAIKADLEAQGAIWIEIDHTAYITYDGNHLHMDSARRLSRDLATMMETNPCE